MIKYIIILPLISALLAGILVLTKKNKFPLIITNLSIFLAMIFSWINFYKFHQTREIISELLFNFIDFAGIKLGYEVVSDSISSMMFVVVTTVSFVVHCYSVGYMRNDKNISKFFCYLSLFTFFMLFLVSSNNLIQLFIGWEGVGLCSYLLIGFWYQKESANRASLKAFLVNRVGDCFFVIALAFIYFTFQSFEFKEIFKNIESYKNISYTFFAYNMNVLDIICVLIFLGAMGKSAQLGLHIWLPDAMEGPTPVSALIHAATMVTAGVFLVVRMSPIFEYSEISRNLIVVIGALTTLFAATIALFQKDIKKIIAYSTCSQLGYMFIACGLSAYGAAMFHLMTHAFFKALLFLCAGNVISAMNHEQDIFNMGGLRKKIPFTFTLMFIGSLALAGIYPLAGYFSKDAIIEISYVSNNLYAEFAYYIGVTVAFMTAFYSWRLIILVFHEHSSIDHKIHSYPKIMNLSLLPLVIGTLCAGVVGIKLGIFDHEKNFWGEAVSMIDMPTIIEKMHSISFQYKIIPTIAAFLGIILAYFFYIFTPEFLKILKQCFRPIYSIYYNKAYIDEIYNFVIVRPFKQLSLIFALLDKKLDEYGPNFLVQVTRRFSVNINYMQTGIINHYTLAIFVGVLIAISWVIWY